MSEELHKNICNQNLFKVFFKKHSKNLHDFLYYKFGERLNPQDKVQDAFIKLWENCKKVPPNKAKSYVYTIANNLMLNEVAHQKVVLKHQKNKPKEHSNESPEFLMEENQYRKKLENAIANLTEAERVAFLMNRTEGKRFKEIAEILDISTKAVEKRIYGALKKLRKEIEGL
ncbi:RNA polymerase sigma-70 factor (ECF subfamily) [Mesoflavibacter sabulilitoris]|uniref:RNA polymerase subunit sigma-70 n=1 Tax=Mesoflavibacter zeaxanthinifaciens subsp. sabulilitoris TaxID=1520893 RepID=A0A2T1NMD1_9FLAO|nr:sigma-70 family RNA polymerase sigma factor [Mesoflavibacter zeaxanthinifaciens]MBB3124682.1 RNA polymerase sigma-70 factor (ECF subfamily) [Mesoflavibacter zeaxanthinifaciens subsp. sabulilitoris]PSG94047.1 RNA polymerase subunit sigma-70 [Mesoflavibacter zeaxanthinifaciens subsp. sabulilitoris]